MHTPFDRPVDVFMVAQKLGLWLTAQPLDNAFGFYLRQGEVAGIVVNSRHPESLQRFTCAHEIGHHVLGHTSHADDRSTLTRYSDLSRQELDAQVFAASLLMPLPLVRRALDSVNSSLGPLTARSVYAFSRTVGVSYSAAVWQLTQYGLLDATRAERLVKRGAAAAKTELRGRTWVEDARADVWLVEQDQDGGVVECRVGDEVHVRLPEDFSLGLVWTLSRPDGGARDRVSMVAHESVQWDGTDHLRLGSAHRIDLLVGEIQPGLEVVVDEHIGALVETSDTEGGQGQFFLDEQTIAAPRAKAEGDLWEARGPGHRRIVFMARQPGRYSIGLNLSHAWKPEAPGPSRFAITMVADARRWLAGIGYANPQRDLRFERLVAA